MKLDWIRQQLDEKGISQLKLAAAIGLTPVQLNKTLQGNRVLRASEADNIRRYFGYTLPEDETPTKVENGEAEPRNKLLVTVYDVAASAGPGIYNEYETQAYSLAFPPNYLAKLTSSSPKFLAIISVKGESMEPTLLDDDIVLFDTSKTSLAYDGLFVLRFDGALHVKRVSRSPKKGSVTIISDNQSLYPPINWPVEDIDVVGKVLWYGRKV